MTAARSAEGAPEAISVGTVGGATPSLLIEEGRGSESLADYRAQGGYAPGLWGRALIDAVEDAGLRGRGGAAFPLGVKLRSVADREGTAVVVANGEEGEPASVKDRWLMRTRPHLVLDGLLRAGEAVGAQRGYVYVSDPASAASVTRALTELSGSEDLASALSLAVVTVAPGYVAGEETSVVRAIDGGEPKPVDKPPRPFERGVGGAPTLVSNVETLAHLARIAVSGPDAFRAHGSAQSAGTVLLTLSGACARPGLYEAPLGVRLGEAFAAAGGFLGPPRGFLMGGFFAGLLGPRAVDMELTYEALRAEGSGLGCGAIVALGPEDCPVSAAADLMRYFTRENAKQCGACIRGTAAMAEVLDALSQGSAEEPQLERLRGWSMSLRGRGACAALDGAANIAASLFREFPQDVAAHTRASCSRCREQQRTGHVDQTRFAVDY